jgi:hypothetical protein
MEVIKIVVQSLEDAKNGKPIVQGHDLDKCQQSKDLTIGILEGGMESGKTSLMFVIMHPDGTSAMAEMSANQFEGLIGCFRGAVQRFGK